VATYYKKEIMSVNVNSVYQRVQSIANKEQRGYITPIEFNRFANQVQLEIFEQYFYDLGQFMRGRGNDTRHADPVDGIEEKISLFEVFGTSATDVGGDGLDELILPTDLYRLSTVLLSQIECEKVSIKKFKQLVQSNIILPTNSQPVYIKSANGIFVYGGKTTSPYYEVKQSGVTVNYIKKPSAVNWAYVIDANNDALYNSAGSTNFELHPTEEANLVIKILEIAGVAMKASDVYQVGDKENIEDIQQQKS
tara:strand:+ start:184 stop:936 length:753 start_codon:yes stop_codon:yes gene_type:complete